MIAARPFRRVVSRLYDAALAPAQWPAALDSLSGALGLAGAAHIIRSRQTGRTEWISLSGPLAERQAEYVDHYSALDPYAAASEAGPGGQWLQLSRCLPSARLRRDEWYNDFVIGSGIGDMLGVKLLESRSHTVIFGLHQGVERPFAVADARLRELIEVLGHATRVHYELRRLGWASTVALRALDQLAAGVIVTDGKGRVIEMNRAAERIVRRGDGLLVRNGKLGARRAFEAAKLAALIAAAAADTENGPAAGRMLVGRGSRIGYVLTVAPLGAELAAYTGPFALVLVADPDELSPSARDLGECFGFSPAESRLAGLMAGRKLPEIAAASGVQITTLRTQLSSILRKVGVDRQADLVRALSSIRGII